MNLSIIIPTFNRAEILDVTLKSFLSLDINRKISYEIIVVDNNSTDRTKQVVENLCNILPIKYLFERIQGKNYALNSAIKATKGDIIVFIDDDVSVNKKWLSTILNSVNKYTHINIFGGKILTEWPNSTPSWVYYSSMNFPYLFCDHDLGNDDTHYSNAPLPAGANYWIRKSLLTKYDASFNVKFGPKGGIRVSGGETEFLKRMKLLGEKMVYIASASVNHRVLMREFKIINLLRRFYSTGKSSLALAHDNISIRYHTIVPLYLVRQILEEMLKFTISFVSLDKNAYMNSAIKLSYFFGKANAFIDKG